MGKGDRPWRWRCSRLQRVSAILSPLINSPSKYTSEPGIRGLRRRLPEIDLVRAQDALPEGMSDPDVLSCAAAENRVLITNDRNTMLGFSYQRVAAGDPMPGLIA